MVNVPDDMNIRRSSLASIFVGFALMALSSHAAAAGFDLRYKAYVGDLNSDGRTDVFVTWKPRFQFIALDDLSIPIPMSRRGVADFVLQQTASGTFTLVTSLSSTQLTTVRSWPEASNAIEVAPGDLNFDGAIDLIVRGLSSVATNAATQFVFASPLPNSAPTNVIALNATLRSFYSDVTQWFLAPYVTVTEQERDYTYLFWVSPPENFPPLNCAFYDGCISFMDDPDDPGRWNPVDDPNQVNVQHWWGYDTETRQVTRKNYFPTDPNAQPFTEALETTIQGGQLNPGFYSNVMQTILNNVYGTPVMNLQQAPSSDMSMEPGTTESIPTVLHDEWRWGRLMGNLLGVFWEVCKYGGEDPQKCWLDIAAPGFSGLSICASHGPFDSGGPYFTYEITSQQRSLASADQRRPFWVSRYQDSCDPFAPSALGVVDERGLGLITLKWLRAIASARGLTIDEQQLGLDIMDAHVSSTDTDAFNIIHLLSKRQITDYHVRVFKQYGLPGYTFGGAPFGTESTSGGFFEWFLGEWMWCPDCDKVP